MIKVYLDDLRTPPDGWVLVKTAQEAIDLLITNDVEEISLDHDLGEEENGTGYDVITWLEKEVYENNFIPPIIHIHTANPVAREKMEAGTRNIVRFKKKYALFLEWGCKNNSPLFHTEILHHELSS